MLSHCVACSLLLCCYCCDTHAHTHTHTATLLFASIKSTCWALPRVAQFQGDLFTLWKDFHQTALDTSESRSQGFIQVHTCTSKTSKQWQAGLLIEPECIFGPLNHSKEISVWFVMFLTSGTEGQTSTKNVFSHRHVKEWPFIENSCSVDMIRLKCLRCTHAWMWLDVTNHTAVDESVIDKHKSSWVWLAEKNVTWVFCLN